MAGQVVHFEIPADDMERCQAFYREAFGWRLNPMPEMSYTLVTTVEPDEQGTPAEPGAINGGMTPRAEPVTHPVVVVNVDDIDQSLQRIQELGGRVVEGRTAVGDMGYSAYFADPEGNVIGLWESAGDGQAG
ncbi:MAG: VOC family protein [Micromonosporaceae bacterium]|jgi:predicted enzyme related to lactoylglutathione lyase